MSFPAAKQGDQVVGVDIHIVMVPSPGGPVPTPLPHPFMGILDSNLSNDVQVNGVPAAMVGSQASNTPPHLPTPPGTTFSIPPTNKARVFMGSATVFVNGNPMARLGDMCMTCNDPTELPVGKIIAASNVLVGGPPSPVGMGGGSSGGGGGSGGSASAAEAATAAGKAGSSAGPGKEAASKADASNKKSWVEFLVKDASGQAVSGVGYELRTPDGKKVKGKLGSDGKVRQDSIPSGDSILYLEGLYNARWSIASTVAGQEVELIVDTPALADGGQVSFKIYREFREGSEETLASVSGPIRNSEARAKWKYSYQKADEGTRPRLVFHASHAKHRAESGPLEVGDEIEITLKNEKGKPVAGAPFQLVASDGEVRTGRSGEGGKILVKGIAFGSCRFRLTDGYRIEKK